ncbi:MAG: rhodanese-like domain-containing protein [Pseudomarimonas sp.]
MTVTLITVSGAWASLAMASGDLPLQRFAAEVEAAYPATPTLTLEAFLAHPDRAEMVIVDARLDAERAVSQLPGAISRQQLRDRLHDGALRAAEPGKPGATPTVLVYCTIGMRSAELTRQLRSEGVPAFNLSGGVLAWAADGHSFVDAKGLPTRRVHVYGRRWNYLPSGYEAVW